MDIQTSLFEGNRIYFAPIDHEKDAEIESKWTHDPEYMSLLSTEPVRPLSIAQVKKKYEAIEKKAEEKNNLFYFAIRTRKDEAGEVGEGDRLVGFAELYWIEWTHGTGAVRLGIGDQKDWGRGYGTEALRLLLHYAFAELNLFRLMAMIPEYNRAALSLFERAGFVEEVRRREALHRAGRRWDLIHMGILREEWHE